MYNATEYQQQNNSILDVTKDVITAFEFSKKIETFLKEDQENNPKLTEEILLTKFISQLTIDKLFEGIVSLQKIIDGKTAYGHHYVKEKDVTIFIGATRAGKSTIMNLLLDNKLVSSKLSGNLFNSFYVLNEKNPSNGQYPKIGHKNISETTIPIVYKVDNKIIIDCPGFGDNRSAQQQIINAWFISELLKNSKGIKVVNVCASTSLAETQNRIEFSSYAKQLQSFFTKDDLCKVKNILFFTKYPNEEKFDGKTEMLKETAIEFIAKDQNNFSRELLKFFNNSKAFSMKSPTKSDVEFTKETIRDMIDYHDKNLNYTKIQPNISLDGDAKSWVLTNKNDMITAIMNSLRKSYWKVYEDGTVKENLESQFSCNVLGIIEIPHILPLLPFIGLLKGIAGAAGAAGAVSNLTLGIAYENFLTMKNMCKKYKFIERDKSSIDKIKNFMGDILKDSNIFTSFKNEMDIVIDSVDLYNQRIIDYSLSQAFFNFLTSSFHNLPSCTYNTIRSMISDLKKTKPKIQDLNLTQLELYKIFSENDKKFRQLKKIIKEDEQNKKMQALEEEVKLQNKQLQDLIKKQQESSWTSFIPIPGLKTLTHLLNPDKVKEININKDILLSFSFSSYMKALKYVEDPNFYKHFYVQRVLFFPAIRFPPEFPHTVSVSIKQKLDGCIPNCYDDRQFIHHQIRCGLNADKDNTDLLSKLSGENIANEYWGEYDSNI